ncbi:Eco57I restriction-modification methylase domain-containing protein [Planococcus kocurii]|uniref:Eco57I restriction-modification methylase domain-containing protein n=1 Tax=Planococcus kocurii TaxID=1374 RepID=UPI003D055161
MSKKSYGAFESKVIYVMAIPDESHKGRLKIGEATFGGHPLDQKGIEEAAKKRINSYTQTADVAYSLLHTELAITYTGEPFRDYQVHEVLERSGISRSVINGRGREWYPVSLETALKAVESVKEGRDSLSSTEISQSITSIMFRPEQERAIEETLESIRKKRDRKLWNAKMRFGKTLTALEVAKRAEFKKTIIITHRPVVSKGWFEDFDKIFHDTSYRFGSKDKGMNLISLLKQGNPFVYFASMQDLRGSKYIGGDLDKNRLIFETEWDFVIVDEAHEGNKTELAQNVHRHISRQFTLGLSGTPFNLFEDYEEESDIFTWDYTMEQQAKQNWDKEHFGDSNPYETLPKLSIFTFHLEKEFSGKQYVEIEDKAFNFREFFRTFPDDDPDISRRGGFVHKEDVRKFLDMITHNDKFRTIKTNFPFATDEYRDNLRNTLWLVPGVREAKALSGLMKEHPVFGLFEIVNVAGNGDDQSENQEALKKVQDAIGSNPGEAYTITITCGRLTTGVSVPAWTGVMMLSNTTSPSTYLQTAFRVQTPASIDGKMKTECYVFDFAPDRTLKMVAQAASLNTKAGKINSSIQKDAMGEFLNFCPIISLDNSEMKQINVDTMLRQLKQAAVERVVTDGFDHNALYSDELLKLDENDLEAFKELQDIIGSSKQARPLNGVTINKQGFDEEEWSKAENAEKKKKKKKLLTPEEEDALKKRNELLKQRRSLISVLRGISIRIPMLIFGANIRAEEEITVDNFIDLIDDLSWMEFMPQDVTKAMFKRFGKYYDKEVFVEAGLKIRRKAKAADAAETVKERVIRISDIFATFKNPDKETVLTPWKVVNRHIGDTLGGEVFFDEAFQWPLTYDEDTRKIEKNIITAHAFDNVDIKILEINSKSGLYPLLACYNIYRTRVKVWRATKHFELLTREDHFELWNKTLKENIFVIAKTPMAKAITERTLRGYQDSNVNVVYYESIMEDVKKDNDNIISNLRRSFKSKEEHNLKFDVVIGNPPYQELDGGAQVSASPIYQHFVRAAKQLNPKYISLIIPSRWYVGGKGLDSFREEMLNDIHISEIHDWLTPENIFPNTNIRGGVCYFLLDSSYDNSRNLTRVVTHQHNEIISDVMRPFKIPGIDIFIRDNVAVQIIEQIYGERNSPDIQLTNTMMGHVSSAKAFGFRGYFVKDKSFRNSQKGLSHPVKCYGLKGAVGYVERSEVLLKSEWIDNWKVFTAESNNIGTELKDDNFNTIIGAPGTVCTETFVVIGADLGLNEEEIQYLSKYLKTKFSRFLHSIAKASQHGTKLTYRFIPMQDFSSNSEIDWSLSSAELDKQLYEKYELTQKEIDHIELKIK